MIIIYLVLIICILLFLQEAQMGLPHPLIATADKGAGSKLSNVFQEQATYLILSKIITTTPHWL